MLCNDEIVYLCRATLQILPTLLLPCQVAFSPPSPPSSTHSLPLHNLLQHLILLSPPPPPSQSLAPPQLGQSSLELQLSHVSTNPTQTPRKILAVRWFIVKNTPSPSPCLTPPPAIISKGFGKGT